MAGNKVVVSQETNYPWQGDVKVAVSPEKESNFAVCLRIPGWVNNQPVPSDLYTFEKNNDDLFTIQVNGEPAKYSKEKGYAVINRDWKKGDVIAYLLPMGIRRVKANPLVKDDEGKVALERGPIVYCVEGADNSDVDKLSVSENTLLTSNFKPELLGGVETISGTNDNGKDAFQAIPYYVWDNRGANKMKVWLPEK